MRRPIFRVEERNTPVISWHNRHQAQRPRRAPARRTTSRRLRACLCLLTLLAQVALVVAHSWEMPVEAVALAVTRAFHAVSHGTEEGTVLSKGVPASRQWRHDPLLCPVCQMLPQVKPSIVPHGPEVILLHASLAWLPGATCSRASLALAVSAPRAPPYSL